MPTQTKANSDSTKIEPELESTPALSMEEVNKIADSANKFLTFLLKASAGVGGGLVFMYCFSEGILPKGIAVGDAFFFLFVVAAFASIYTIGTAYGMLASIIPTQILLWVMTGGRSKIAKWDPLWLMNIFSGLILLLFIAGSNSSDQYNLIVTYFILEGVLINFIYFSSRVEESQMGKGTLWIRRICRIVWMLITLRSLYFWLKQNQKKTLSPKWRWFFNISIRLLAFRQATEKTPPSDEKTSRSAPHKRNQFLSAILLLVILFLPAFMIHGAFGSLLDISMQKLGIRAKGVYLRLNEDNFHHVEAIAKREGLIVLGCGIVGISDRLVGPVDIIWHGLGEKAFVEFPNTPKPQATAAKHSPIRLELDASGIAVARNLNPTERCIEFSSDLLFDPKSSVLRPSAQIILDKTVNSLSALKDEPKIEVIGFTDPSPLRGDTNLALSGRHAKAVASFLETRLGKNTHFKIATRGLGPSELRVFCGHKETSEELVACNAPNRRVEIHITPKENPNKDPTLSHK